MIHLKTYESFKSEEQLDESLMSKTKALVLSSSIAFASMFFPSTLRDDAGKVLSQFPTDQIKSMEYHGMKYDQFMDNYCEGLSDEDSEKLYKGYMNLVKNLSSDMPEIPDFGMSRVSIIENIIEAENKTFEPKWFYNQVRNKGPWDFKQRGSQFADFGNFNFGACGAAHGFPEDVLMRMAGWAQNRAGTSDDSWGSPYTGTGSYGDDPQDQDMIRKGIEFYNMYKNSVSDPDQSVDISRSWVQR